MRIVYAIGRFLSGLIATIGGLFALICNDVAFAIFNNMSYISRYICVTLLILLGILLVVVSIHDLVTIFYNDSYQHQLKYQSKKFIKFFSKWYSRPGTLSIICDNFDWVKNDTNNCIYNELLKKSRQNELYLFLVKEFDSDTVTKLKEVGAHVFPAPKRIVDNFTFSCLSVMGNSAGRVIVRNKQKDKGSVVIFDEIQNTYVTELLNTLLAYWREQNDYQSQKTDKV